MRRRTLAGIVTTLIVVAGLTSMAQGPEPGRLPLPPAEEAELPPFTPGAPPLPGAASSPDDPMQAVEAFVQRNRKEADEAIKALTQERDSLRERLKKVEAALGRWKAVAGALERSQAVDLDPTDPDSIPITEPPIAPTIPLPEVKPEVKPR